MPFVRKRGIGRDTVRSLRSYCQNVLRTQGYNGSIIDVLCQLFQRTGEDTFMETHVPYITGVGPKRAELILSVVKEQLEIDT